MLPADQGFNAGDSAIAERDLRLIMNREALGLERTLETLFDAQAF